MPRKKKLNLSIMSLRYPISLKKKLEKIAEKEHRTLTDQIIYVLERWVEKQS
jgi:hypothetical protein